MVNSISSVNNSVNFGTNVKSVVKYIKKNPALPWSNSDIIETMHKLSNDGKRRKLIIKADKTANTKSLFLNKDEIFKVPSIHFFNTLNSFFEKGTTDYNPVKHLDIMEKTFIKERQLKQLQAEKTKKVLKQFGL